MSDSIVVGTDGSETAGRALDEAIRLARALEADLHIVSAYQPPQGVKIQGAPEGAAKVWQPMPDHFVNKTVDEAAFKVRTSGLDVNTHPIRDGDAADALLRVADEVGASMIVVGSRGMHGARRVLGSVPNKVSHQARCNVLIVATEGD